MPGPQLFDYHAFIEELRILHGAFRDPPHNHRTASSLEFKQWKHELVTLIDEVQSLGYEIQCGVALRAFRVASTYYPVPNREQLAAFDRDLEDTNLEIQTILKRYESYGDPKRNVSATATVSLVEETSSNQLKAPEKVTWNWLKEHVPVGPAITVISTVVTACFLGGIYVGQSSFYRSFMTPASRVSPTTAEPATSIEKSAASAAPAIDSSKPSVSIPSQNKGN